MTQTPQGAEYWKNRPRNDPKMDWSKDATDWLDDYEKSKDHPHRDKIVEIVGNFRDVKNILEIGCNTGVNLDRIHEKYPDISLHGFDINPDAVKIAQKKGHKVIEHDILDLFPVTENVSCLLSDAVLMYVEPKDIKRVFDEIDRVTDKHIILIEWESQSISGEIRSYHWTRNYQAILELYGFDVEKIKITEEIWPTATWQELGYIYVATRKNAVSKGTQIVENKEKLY